MRKFSTLLFVLIIKVIVSQDIHFSQMPFAPLALNPALAGANQSNQANLVYRDQWRNADAQFTTIYASYDQRFLENSKKGFVAGGLSFFSDKAGDSKFTTNYTGLSVGYHVRLASHQLLGLCVQPSYGQRSVDYSALRWGMQYDGNGYNSSLSNGEPISSSNQISFFDINAGLVYTYKSSEHYMTSNDHLLINAGYSISHINQPKNTFYGLGDERLYMKHILFANAQIGLNNSKISLLPGVYSMFQGSHSEILFGSYFRYSLQDKSVYTGIKKGSAISLGGFYRLGDALAVKSMIDWGQLSFGFTYDFNLSSLTPATEGWGGFEIAIRFVSPNPFGGASKSRI
jgi:type IX secretion system PorP/SprF family membrane protein